MKYKFDHKSKSSVKALGVDKSILKEKLKSVTKRMEDREAFPTFSELAEELSTLFTKRELLYFATSNILTRFYGI